MGGRNKLLIALDGEALVRRTARTLLASGLAGVTVVTGHQGAAVWAAMGDLPLQRVHNDAYRDGQMSSMCRGFLALDPAAADAVLVCPADMPALTVDSVARIVRASAEDGGRHVIVPFCDGCRGNPIVVPMRWRDRVEAGGVNFGCRNLIATHPEAVRTVELGRDDILQDLDTPDALAAWPGAVVPEPDVPSTSS